MREIVECLLGGIVNQFELTGLGVVVVVVGNSGGIDSAVTLAWNVWC